MHNFYNGLWILLLIRTGGLIVSVECAVSYSVHTIFIVKTFRKNKKRIIIIWRTHFLTDIEIVQLNTFVYNGHVKNFTTNINFIQRYFLKIIKLIITRAQVSNYYAIRSLLVVVIAYYDYIYIIIYIVVKKLTSFTIKEP